MEKIILQLFKAKAKDRDLDLLTQFKRDFSKINKLPDLPSNIQLLQAYYMLLKAKKIVKTPQIEQLLKKKGMRSQSGIVSVQVLTKPFYCPGKCIFCPNDPTMPKSYIKSEPGAMRALMNKFDPIKQVYNRLLSLTLTGHETDKIELIVLGGTWDVYPKDYKIKFIKELYDACNTFDEYFANIEMSATQKYAHTTIDDTKKIKYSKDLKQALKKNETTAHRIIGLTIETRPEYVTDINCQFRREFGVTRVEMGIQSLDDKVLDMNKRGHSVQQSRNACHKLRQYGFKFALHVMPGLYGSSYAKDLKTFKDLYSDPFFKPDEIKFYPTSVIPDTELFELYKQGKYKPLETEDIKKLIREVFFEVIPPYTRIKRLIRDIPANEIVAGSTVTNLSQLMHTQLLKEQKIKPGARKKFYQRLYGKYTLYVSLQKALKDELAKIVEKSDEIHTYLIGSQPDVKSFRNYVSLDTRSREIRNKLKTENSKEKSFVNMVIRKYLSSGGVEYFISCEDEMGFLYGFTRLLLIDQKNIINIPGLGKSTALIRELHVYGQVEGLEKKVKKNSKVQHKGFGKQLMELAEAIAHQHKYKKLSVISGIGVKEYYKRLGYKSEGTYVVKKLV
ncbi:MAG: tRNA uridine(34) 5-carboxymethylaminomethyl modification radical SAM/GNAT enzyme Elp3 [candidate division SR1 bacterium]|nr:tRNA uridine(34) 5-carboxymethylaminomethyl modification radical SAM/GNAT enzyme Elp3 [candidate division SR1 bacterium]